MLTFCRFIIEFLPSPLSFPLPKSSLPYRPPEAFYGDRVGRAKIKRGGLNEICWRSSVFLEILNSSLKEPHESRSKDCTLYVLYTSSSNRFPPLIVSLLRRFSSAYSVVGRGGGRSLLIFHPLPFASSRSLLFGPSPFSAKAF